MPIAKVKATGNFLSTYHTDLIYIRDFQRYKKGQISATNYLRKSEGTFYQFLIEFRVMRNVKKTKLAQLLTETTIWTNKFESVHVDNFAKHLKRQGITHEKVMTSLASKILFLNDPWAVFPLDNRVKKSLNQKNNSYSDFLPRIHQFKKENEGYAINSLSIVKSFLIEIEHGFGEELRNIEIIRLNRFTDKLLWSGVKSNE